MVVIDNAIYFTCRHTFGSSIYKCFEFSLPSHLWSPAFVCQVLNRIHVADWIIRIVADFEQKACDLLINLGITKNYREQEYSCIFYLVLLAFLAACGKGLSIDY